MEGGLVAKIYFFFFRYELETYIGSLQMGSSSIFIEGARGIHNWIVEGHGLYNIYFLHIIRGQLPPRNDALVL